MMLLYFAWERKKALHNGTPNKKNYSFDSFAIITDLKAQVSV